MRNVVLETESGEIPYPMMQWKILLRSITYFWPYPPPARWNRSEETSSEMWWLWCRVDLCWVHRNRETCGKTLKDWQLVRKFKSNSALQDFIESFSSFRRSAEHFTARRNRVLSFFDIFPLSELVCTYDKLSMLWLLIVNPRFRFTLVRGGCGYT